MVVSRVKKMVGVEGGKKSLSCLRLEVDGRTLVILELLLRKII